MALIHLQTNIGSEEQWQPMEARSPGLIHAMDELIDVSGKVAETPVELHTLAHELVFAISRVCIEECWEIFLLAANQYETGAFKMLRGLYERALTMTYISKFPEKAERFRDYAAVQEHRALAHARKLFSDETLNDAWKPLTVADIEANYERIKPAFQKTKCKTCKTTEAAHSWDIDLASMAEKTGEGFPELLLSAYISPTMQAHATLASALSRTTTEEGRVLFNYIRNPADIDMCLAQTFILMQIVLKVTIRMFSLPLEKDLERFEQANLQAWGKEG